MTAGDQAIGLHGTDEKSEPQAKPASRVGHGATITLLALSDIDKLFAEWKSRGVRFSVDTLNDTPQGKTASFQDSEGNWLYLMQPPRYH